MQNCVTCNSAVDDITDCIASDITESSFAGQHPSALLLITPAPAGSGSRRLPAPSQAVRGQTRKILPRQKQPAVPSAAAASTSTSLTGCPDPAAPLLSETLPAFVSPGSLKPLAPSAPGLSPGLSPVSAAAQSAVAFCSPVASFSSPHSTVPLSNAAAVLPATFGQSSRHAAVDGPKTVGANFTVNFEKIYKFLSVVQNPSEDYNLTPMESAIVLDLLMSLPEEILYLDCKNLQKHLIQQLSKTWPADLFTPEAASGHTPEPGNPISAMVDSLKKKTISSARFQLRMKNWEEKQFSRPIEEWTHMASTLAGTLEKVISAAFSQMLVVSSTEPCTLMNCDPKQDPRPAVGCRPVPRVPKKKTNFWSEELCFRINKLSGTRKGLRGGRKSAASASSGWPEEVAPLSAAPAASASWLHLWLGSAAVAGPLSTRRAFFSFDISCFAGTEQTGAERL
ncbi:hypothetical protein CCH79_00014488 [Gambusia affinis]|uniref:Uncharacterized protein n=1 Tax=Gambusia affinis TaxID=33528 RepID=A0A315UVI9_GAMAF|nr:hypothetical protein CCH79_00014488 [Gambusia affinis]